MPSSFEIRRPQKKTRFFSGVRSFSLICALMILGSAYWVYSAGEVPVTGQFQVAKGDSVYTLRSALKADISDFRYKMYVRFFAKPVRLQSGIYTTSSGTTLSTVFSSILANPPTSKDISITILPGWNVFDIEAVLVEQGLCGSGEITKPSKTLFESLQKKYAFLSASNESLEGFLYPDTYRFNPSFWLESTLSKMLDNFNKKIASRYTFGDSGAFYRTLIMGSIIEKEERNTDNKPTVAGILWNRITKHDFIGADATICYPYNVMTLDCTPSFILDHLYEKTAYNTRMQVWLPPTPISNMTFDSFSAAKNPDSTSYYYYLHDKDGNIHYATTAEEHAINKSRYLH